MSLRGMRFVPLSPMSAVTTNLLWAALTRWANASDENPANTTECTAPNRAHASIVMGSCGIMGM